MKRHIALIIGFFSIHTIQSMENLNNENRYEHMRIAKQAKQLIDRSIDAITISKWQHVLEEAEKFQQANPKFPYRLLARRPGQGPDAQSITEAAPVIIDFLQHKPVEPEKLRKLRYTVGNHYIAKMLDLNAEAFAEWNSMVKEEAKKSAPRLSYPVQYSKKTITPIAPMIDFLPEEKSSILSDPNVELIICSSYSRLCID